MGRDSGAGGARLAADVARLSADGVSLSKTNNFQVLFDWVKAMEAFSNMTKLVKAFGLFDKVI